MLSYHSWLTRSFVIGCSVIIAGRQDHLLSDVVLSQLTDKIICYQMLSYHSWQTSSFFYRMFSYHSWQTRSIVTGCSAITASRKDNLLLDVYLSQLADKIICYRMSSHHSWLKRSFVTGCLTISASRDHLLLDNFHIVTGCLDITAGRKDICYWMFTNQFFHKTFNS